MIFNTTRVTNTLLALGLAIIVSLASISFGFAQDNDAYIRRVPSMDSDKTGALNPVGLTFSSQSDNFYVVEDPGRRSSLAANSDVIVITPLANRSGSARIATTIEDPLNMAFDNQNNRLLAFQPSTGQLLEVRENPDGNLERALVIRHDVRRLGIQEPRGLAFDEGSGTLFILDAVGPRIVRLQLGPGRAITGGRVSVIELASSGLVAPRGIALDPTTGHLHVFDLIDQNMYELSQSGQVITTRDMVPFGLKSPQAMVFAPSGDQTDHPAQMSLFLADSGLITGRGTGSRILSSSQVLDEPGTSAQSTGQILELSLVEPAAAAASSFTSSLVKTTDLSAVSPPSPDPSGIAYLPSNNRLMVVDGEVEETVDGITHFQGANVWELTLGGSVIRTANISKVAPTVVPMTNEPTGVAWNPNNGHFYFSDDGGPRSVWDLNPGPDGLVGTADDSWTSFSTAPVGGNDPEGIAYDTWNNRLFVADGVNAEIYEFTLTGTLVNQFDVLAYGVVDPEAVEFNPDSGTLFIMSSNRTSPVIIETTTSGVLLQTIDISATNARTAAGLAYAPASNGSGAKRFYIVDRGIDNNNNPSLIDGKMYEITTPPSGPTPTPSQTFTPGPSPTASATPTVSSETELRFAPVADSYIQESSPTSNYGSATTLQTDASPIKHFLMKFDVSGINGQQVIAARLRLYNVDSSPGGGNFYHVSDDSWQERTVTWNTAPAADPTLLYSLGSVSAGNFYDVDLTSLIKSDGTYSLRISSTSTNGADYSSREGSNPPQLTIILEDGPTPVVTPTNTLTITPTHTITFTPTFTMTGTPTANSTLTNTPIFTTTFTPTATNTPTNTAVPGASPTNTPTALPSGNSFFASFASSGTVNGISFADEDILHFDGQNWSLIFDGSDVGVGSTDLFAFSIVDADTILMALSSAVTVNGLEIAPQDIVRFDATSLGSTTAGTFSMYLDGSDVGLDTTSEKIDALSVLPDGRVLVSTTGSPSVPGVSGRDEDILAFTPTSLGDNTTGTWAMYFDGSDVGLANTSGEDIDALDVVGGKIYLSTTGDFSVNGVAGADEDIFVCTPVSLGDATACNYASELFFDGSTLGLSGNDLDAFHLATADSIMTPPPLTTSTPTRTPTPTNTPTRTQTPMSSFTYTPTFTPTNTPLPGSSPTNTPTATPVPASTNTPTAPSITTLVFTPTDDATVLASSPDTNSGKATSLLVDSSPVKHFLLKFTVSGINGQPITSAKLRLYNVNTSNIGGEFYRVSDNNWSETTITWNNSPAADTEVLATLGSVSPNIWYEVDLATLITGDGAYSLRVTSPSSNGADYSSKEGGFPPELVITIGQ